LGPGGVYPGADAADLRVDAEVALEVGADARPSRFGAALELVDVHRPPGEFESIVAGNIWHRAFVLGRLRTAPPDDGMVATVYVNGELRGSAPVGNEFAAAAPIADRLLAAVSERLESGDRIIAGSLVHVPVAPGDEIVVDLGSLGRTSATISEPPPRGTRRAAR
jgi:2-keto-4-pentenoate hydratase